MTQVIKSIDFPDKEFNSKRELFSELKANKDALINMKKSVIKTSDSIPFVATKSTSNKSLYTKENESIHVINTTGVVDSHLDLHVKGIWNKSVKEQQNKIYFLADHVMSLKNIISYPNDVAMSIDSVDWVDLGFGYKGSTDALIFRVKKDDIQLSEVKTIIEKKVPIEHSVCMQYVKVDLAINSDDDEFKVEKSNWDASIEGVSNKESLKDLDYYWIISEAKIINEGSMVLKGSNSHTPMIINIEPSQDTQKAEPSQDTQNTNNYINFLKNL